MDANGRKIAIALTERFVRCNRPDTLNSQHLPSQVGYTQFMVHSVRIGLRVSLLVLVLVLVLVLILTACNALNPLCGSARPAPTLDSISPTTLVFAQLPPSFVLSLTGSHFVSASVVVFNGVSLVTTEVSSSELTANITSSMITAPGSFTVVVQTPGGNSSDLGCSSGGTSSGQVLSVN
jgi:hypothetical protein